MSEASKSKKISEMIIRKRIPSVHRINEKWKDGNIERLTERKAREKKKL
jgi:hypothetical protein